MGVISPTRALFLPKLAKTLKSGEEGGGAAGSGRGVAQPGSPTNTDSERTSAVQFLITEYSLTPRERDIFALLANGRNRKYVSEELTITEETVKSHISNIYRKLGVHTQ